MKTRKITALLLCLLLLASALAGCGGSKEAPQPTDAPETSPEAADAPEETQAPDPDPADAQADAEAQAQAVRDTLLAVRDTYAPDTVVFTADGRDVTWGMFYYFLAGDLEELAYYTGSLPGDFNQPLTEELTFAEYFLRSARSSCVYYAVARNKAEELDAGLTEEEEARVQEYWQKLVDNYGGEEETAEALREACLDKETYLTFLRSSQELSNVMEQRCGLAGERLTDEQVNAWAADQGYARAKHILYYFYDDQGQPLDDAAKAALKIKADETLAELQALSDDPAALEARFDEIMAADTGDPGLADFPQGYTFPANTMYEEFEEAAFALEDYALSEIVESESGYHIILRLPLLPEGATLNRNSNTGAYMTLRESAANDLFSRELAGWINDAEIQWAQGFEDLDLNRLFAVEK